MASATYKKMVYMIRCRREMIETELESRAFDSWRSATEIMCATWFIRGHLEKMHDTLDNIYWNNDTDLTRREDMALDRYIGKLENYYWNLLYDKGNNINAELLEGRNKL